MIGLFFYQGGPISSVDFFFDGCSNVVLHIDRSGKLNKGFPKATLAFMVPYGIFYFPELLIYFLEALNEIWHDIYI